MALRGQFYAVPLAWLALFALILAIDESRSPGAFVAFFDSIARPEPQQAINNLGDAGKIISSMLFAVFTVSILVVQIAVIRFTPLIISLFTRSRVISAFIGFFVSSQLFTIWTSLSISDDHVPMTMVLMAMILFTISVVLLFPFFMFLLDFLDPNKVVHNLRLTCMSAVEAHVGKAIGDGTDEMLEIDSKKSSVVASLDRLADIGLKALEARQKIVVTSVVSNLHTFLVDYMALKRNLPPDWFIISHLSHQHPDFLTLSSHDIASLAERRTWIEWKVMRKFQAIFSEAIGDLKDVTYQIANATKLIAVSAIGQREFAVLRMCIKFMNTFVRNAISMRDVRTLYNIFHHYRLLVEDILKRTAPEHLAADAEAAVPGVVHMLALVTNEVVGYFRYYARVCFEAKLVFVSEIIAFDLGLLCELAFSLRHALHEEILESLLGLNETITGQSGTVIPGVRRCQMKMAVKYMMEDVKSPHAACLINGLMGDEPDELMAVFDVFEKSDKEDFWEVNDRGHNFDFLTPPEKVKLRIVRARFEDATAFKMNVTAHLSHVHTTAKIIESPPLLTVVSESRLGDMATTSHARSSIDEAGEKFSPPEQKRNTRLDPSIDSDGEVDQPMRPGGRPSRRLTHTIMGEMAARRASAASVDGNLARLGRRMVYSTPATEEGKARALVTESPPPTPGTDNMERFVTSVGRQSLKTNQSLRDNRAQRTRKQLAVRFFITHLFVPSAALFMLILSIGVDALFSGRALSGFGNAIVSPSSGQVYSAMGVFGHVNGMFIGLVLTVSTIIVQISATQFTPLITSMFFRDPTVFLTGGFFVVTNLFLVWVSFSSNSSFLSETGVIFSLFLLTMNLVALGPYFRYLLRFLESRKIITRLRGQAIEAIRPSSDRAGGHADHSPQSSRLGDLEAAAHQLAPVEEDPAMLAICEVRKAKALDVIEHLSDLGLAAVTKFDVNMTSHVLNVLAEIALFYGHCKPYLPQAWHAMPTASASNLDYISLSNSALDKLEDRAIWFEWKILRQYQQLYAAAFAAGKQSCHLVVLHMRRLAEDAVARGDGHVLDMVIKFLNSVLRFCINHRAVRQGFNTLYQYRLLIECMIASPGRSGKGSMAQRARSSMSDTTDGDDPVYNFGLPSAPGARRVPVSPLADDDRIIEFATYLKYYGSICKQQGLAFMVDVVCHDLGSIVACAFTAGHAVHEDLFVMLMSFIDTIGEGRPSKGMRCAQVKLATLYVCGRPQEAHQTVSSKNKDNDDAADYLARLTKSLMQESPARLAAVWKEMQQAKTREFWEVSDRGSNLNWLPRDQRNKLGVVFSAFRHMDIENLAKIAGSNDDDAWSDAKTLAEVAVQHELLSRPSMITGNVLTRHVTADPSRFARARIAIWRHGGAALVCFIALVVILTSTFLASLLWDRLAGVPSSSAFTIGTFFNQDVTGARVVMSTLVTTMAILLVLLVTISIVIVHIAAARITPLITSLFFHDRTIFLTLALFMASNILLFWVHFSITDTYVPEIAVFISLLLVTAGTLIVVPYFSYILCFFDPAAVVSRMTHDIVERGTPVAGDSTRKIRSRQMRVLTTFDDVMHLILQAIQWKDKSMVVTGMDTMCSFLIAYWDKKGSVSHSAWFDVTPEMHSNTAFVFLGPDSLGNLVRTRGWVEWKLLYTMQFIFVELLSSFRSVTYLVSVNTLFLGRAACDRCDLASVQMCMKFMNTYIRHSLTAGDVRTVFNVLHHYRQLAEYMLESAGMHNEAWSSKMQVAVVQIAHYLRLYSIAFMDARIFFLAEMAAHDVGQIVERAFLLKRACHQPLLDIFLVLDDVAAEDNNEVSLRGIRRAQIKLATTYLRHDSPAFARQIQRDMADEGDERLEGILFELTYVEADEFWEVNDRGTNVDYLTPQQKAELPNFLRLFDSYKDAAPAGSVLGSGRSSIHRTESDLPRTNSHGSSDFPRPYMTRSESMEFPQSLNSTPRTAVPANAVVGPDSGSESESGEPASATTLGAAAGFAFDSELTDGSTANPRSRVISNADSIVSRTSTGRGRHGQLPSLPGQTSSDELIGLDDDEAARRRVSATHSSVGGTHSQHRVLPSFLLAAEEAVVLAKSETTTYAKTRSFAHSIEVELAGEVWRRRNPDPLPSLSPNVADPDALEASGEMTDTERAGNDGPASPRSVRSLRSNSSNVLPAVLSSVGAVATSAPTEYVGMLGAGDDGSIASALASHSDLGSEAEGLRPSIVYGRNAARKILSTSTEQSTALVRQHELEVLSQMVVTKEDTEAAKLTTVDERSLATRSRASREQHTPQAGLRLPALGLVGNDQDRMDNAPQIGTPHKTVDALAKRARLSLNPELSSRSGVFTLPVETAGAMRKDVAMAQDKLEREKTALAEMNIENGSPAAADAEADDTQVERTASGSGYQTPASPLGSSSQLLLSGDGASPDLGRRKSMALNDRSLMRRRSTIDANSFLRRSSIVSVDSKSSLGGPKPSQSPTRPNVSKAERRSRLGQHSESATVIALPSDDEPAPSGRGARAGSRRSSSHNRASDVSGGGSASEQHDTDLTVGGGMTTDDSAKVQTISAAPLATIQHAVDPMGMTYSPPGPGPRGPPSGPFQTLPRRFPRADSDTAADDESVSSGTGNANDEVDEGVLFDEDSPEPGLEASVGKTSETVTGSRKSGIGMRFFLRLFVTFSYFPLVAIVLLVLALVIDIAAEDHATLTLVLETAAPRSPAPVNILVSIGEVLSMHLRVVLVVSTIAVQISAFRFTPLITSMFFQDRVIFSVLCTFVTGCTAVIWVRFAADSDALPTVSVVVAVLIVVVCLALVVPFYVYILTFLQPSEIIKHITSQALRAGEDHSSSAAARWGRLKGALCGWRGRNTVARYAESDAGSNVGGDAGGAGSGSTMQWSADRERTTMESIERLSDLALKALTWSDRIIAAQVCHALAEFVTKYAEFKNDLSEQWFAIPDHKRRSPDFVNLSTSAIERLVDRRTWVEWATLRQYQLLYMAALESGRELCYIVAFNTRKIGIDAVQRRDVFSLDLCIKFFNTYLRFAINASDVSVCYNVLHQYSQLAQNILEITELDMARTRVEPDTIRRQALLSLLDEIQHRVVQIALFLCYYSSVCLERKLSFISQIIAYDMGTICETAFSVGSSIHSDLLKLFMTMDDNPSAKGDMVTTRAVRRAQVKLATLYLLHSEAVHANRVCDDFKDENGDVDPEFMSQLWAELMMCDQKEYWEVVDRGRNFDYLPPSQKELLPIFFSLFPGSERISQPTASRLIEVGQMRAIELADGLDASRAENLDAVAGEANDTDAARTTTTDGTGGRNRRTLSASGSVKFEKRGPGFQRVGMDVKRQADLMRSIKRTRWFNRLALSLMVPVTFVLLLVIGLVAQLAAGREAIVDFGRALLQSSTYANTPSATASMPLMASTLLVLVVSVSTLVVQIAATRFTPLIIVLFFRDRVILSMIGVFIGTEVLILFTTHLSNGPHHLSAVILLTLAALTLCILLLFPYFAYLLRFLDPLNIVKRMDSSGEQLLAQVRTMAHAALEVRNATVSRDAMSSAIAVGSKEDLVGRRKLRLRLLQLDDLKLELSDLIERLSDLGIKSLYWKDGNVATQVLDTLCNVCVAHGQLKHEILTELPSWFRVHSEWRLSTPEFLSLSADAVDDLIRRRTWFEWKVLRQYLILYGEALKTMKDMCHLIGLGTRRIGLAATKRSDFASIDLIIKFFNSYLRVALNASDVRTAFNILAQYAGLAQDLIEYVGELTTTGQRTEATAVRKRVKSIIDYMCIYGNLFNDRSIPFIAVIAAHDASGLARRAMKANSTWATELANTVIDFISGIRAKAGAESTIIGLRLAELKIGITCLDNSAYNEILTRIQDDIIGESKPLLVRLTEEVASVNTAEFWEVNDRGVNMNFLVASERVLLTRLLAPVLDSDAGSDVTRTTDTQTRMSAGAGAAVSGEEENFEQNIRSAFGGDAPVPQSLQSLPHVPVLSSADGDHAKEQAAVARTASLPPARAGKLEPITKP